jgi:hypothetical protein
MRGAGVMKVPKGKGKPGSLGRAAGGTARLQGCASKSEWSKVGEMIDNREELIDALTEASEIEHGLMIQYLYAAFTMKRELGEGLTTRQQMLNRQWLANIMTVARQEMGHLGIVCNLLTAIGGGPRLGRPNMPRKTGYYPFPFDLLPFNDTALYRFMVFELPQGMSLPPPPGADLRAPAAPELEMLRPAPDELKYQYVGELYAKIADGFRAIRVGRFSSKRTSPPHQILNAAPPCRALALKLRRKRGKRTGRVSLLCRLPDGYFCCPLDAGAPSLGGTILC